EHFEQYLDVYRTNYLYLGYNDFYDYLEEPVLGVIDTVIEGNIEENPMLTSEEDGFKLQAYSPCIDAGHPDILDVDGTRSDMGHTGGPGGFTYQYQDLAPDTPDTLLINVSGDSAILSWTPNDEADINSYNLYKGLEPDFPLITPYENITHPESTTVDVVNPDTTYYFKLTAVDMNFHESNPTNEVSTNPTGFNDDPHRNIPTGISLLSNHPNPFNSATFILYEINCDGYEHVDLSIYNVMGQKVKTIVDKLQTSGSYDFIWEAKDDDGRPVSSGTYFLILRKGGDVKRTKMALLK
ncbi:MAG: T9SS type A sorting domain-containing protein, partial [candidate division Zixibacteria bacterium]|nr:T9SS type A sorting domain-containing protein [candidate division Zixibacteria bacterium]